MTKCFWQIYQKTGANEDLTRWLKHRAYIHGLGICKREQGVPDKTVLRFSEGN